MEYTIRRALSTDEKVLKSLIAEFKDYESQYEAAFRLEESAVNELYDHELVGDGKYAYVAELNDQIHGFVAFEESAKNDPLITEHIPVVYISALFVSPQARGAGLGRALMAEAEKYAKDRNIKFLKLLVFSNNELAKNFYSRSGFQDYETAMIKEIL